MAFIPTPNGISLCFHFTTAGQNWQFCLNFRKSAGSVTPTDLQDVAEEGETWFGVELDTHMSSDVTLADVTATDISVEGGQQHVITTNDPGTAAADPLPLNVALCWSLRTAKRGRSYRGRAYLSGIPNDQYVDSVLANSTFCALLVSDLQALQATLDGLGYDLVVVSKQHNGVETNPAEANEVISIIMDNKFDSMRTRLSGRGT